MLPIARGSGASQDAATSGANACSGRVDPSSVQFLRITDQRRAENIVLLDKDYAFAGLGGFKRGD